MASSNCDLPGWGVAPWGTAPWGGVSSAVSGGPLPTHAPFDVYCAGPCGEISVLLTHPEVSVTGDFTVDPVTGDILASSSDGTEAHLFITDAPSTSWTFEFTINGAALPFDFSDIEHNHLFVGVVNQATKAAGLFFSQIGVAYAATVDAALQPLADSENFFSQGEYYVVRMAVNGTSSTVYVYITKLTDYVHFGHQLRYILPAIPYNATPETQVSGTHLYALGTVLEPTEVFLDEICLGNGVSIPNLPPVANAGNDQAVKFCDIIWLDGSSSFDPEGAPLTYFWRLIDAPAESASSFQGTDGTTHPAISPTGFTNKFYSTGFGPTDPIPLQAGDVLLVDGQPYRCVLISSDGDGYYVQIDGNDLPDSLTNVSYTILLQNGISGAATATPTFYPDVLGFYRFDLTVFDGSLFSNPHSVVVVNVVASALPRGIVPDLSFIWDYLSDVWKLLEDPERIATFWGSISQIAATELYTLWQVDYSKSLKDIQRTFVRRWLHYDLLLREPFIEITANRFIFRGVDSSQIANAGGSFSGQQLVLTGTYLRAVVTLTGSNPLTPLEIARQLQVGLAQVDARFVVTVVESGTSHTLVRIYAPFAFEVDPASSTTFFTISAQNGQLSGAGGVLLGQQVYKTEISLAGLDIRQNDNLVVTVHPPGQAAYGLSVRIAGITDVSTDALRFQRILLRDPLPLYATNTWSIPSKALSTQLNFWGGLVTTGDVSLYEVVDGETGTTTFYQTRVICATESQTNTVLLDASAISNFLQLPDRFTVFFWGVYRRSYMPIEPLIVDIPHLQRVIKDPSEDEVLRRNLDFFLDSFRGTHCLRFDTRIWADSEDVLSVAPRFWAEYNYLDNRPTIEGNFGLAVDFTLDDLSQLPATVDYLSSVQGLWYAYLHGPTLLDLRIGTQILLGLPFAEAAGTITEIRSDFSPNSGRILVQDTADATITRSYSYPATLKLETNPATGAPYVEGDVVTQFAPLVTGVVVTDWVKNPRWFEKYLQQGAFLEIEKYFKFLVTVDSAVFNLPALLFVRDFLLKVKPTYTYPLFVVTASVPDADITVTDEISYSITLTLSAGALYGVKQVTAVDAPDPGPGQLLAGVPTPWSGELSSHYKDAIDTNTDADYPTDTFPTFPDSDVVITMGADRPHLSPAQFSTAFASTVFAGGSPTLDEYIFRTGFPAYEGAQYALGAKYVTVAPQTALAVGEPVIAAGTQSLNCCEIFVEGLFDSGEGTVFNLEIYLNGVLNQTLSFTYVDLERSTYLYTDYLASFTPIAVVASDVISIKLGAAGVSDVHTFWNNFFVTLGSGVVLGVLPAGTYTRMAAL